MYAIAERSGQAGQLQSSENCRYWMRWRGGQLEQTPASDEAAQFETMEEAQTAMADAGLDTSDSGWLAVIDLGDDD